LNIKSIEKYTKVFNFINFIVYYPLVLMYKLILQHIVMFLLYINESNLHAKMA
jgi:hypothetical protein